MDKVGEHIDADDEYDEDGEVRKVCHAMLTKGTDFVMHDAEHEHDVDMLMYLKKRSSKIMIN